MFLKWVVLIFALSCSATTAEASWIKTCAKRIALLMVGPPKYARDVLSNLSPELSFKQKLEVFRQALLKSPEDWRLWSQLGELAYSESFQGAENRSAALDIAIRAFDNAILYYLQLKNINKSTLESLRKKMLQAETRDGDFIAISRALNPYYILAGLPQFREPAHSRSSNGDQIDLSSFTQATDDSLDAISLALDKLAGLSSDELQQIYPTKDAPKSYDDVFYKLYGDFIFILELHLHRIAIIYSDGETEVALQFYERVFDLLIKIPVRYFFNPQISKQEGWESIDIEGTSLEKVVEFLEQLNLDTAHLESLKSRLKLRLTNLQENDFTSSGTVNALISHI